MPGDPGPDRAAASPASEPPKASNDTASRDAAVRVITELRAAGHVAYLAGGCVRDRVLGEQPTDHDVATDAPPEVVRRVWRRSRYVGEAFGVVLARLGPHQVEVATFRRESGYDDHRRPSEVHFTDAREDASRRDFTINGLFEDPAGPGYQPPLDVPHARTRRLDEGSVVIDYVGGLIDLERRVVRAIGEPSRRFDEDYLRMLRAVRFAARLGFDLDDDTARAIRPLGRYLGSISRERIGDETRKMLLGPRPATAAALCQSLRLDGPTLNEDHAEPALPTLEAFEARGIAAALQVPLAAWMLDRHAPGGGLDRLADFAAGTAERTIKRWRDALNLSNAERDATARLFRALGELHHWPTLGKAARKRLLAHPGWDAAVALLAAVPGDDCRRLEARVHAEAPPLIAEGVAPEPLIRGDDLLTLGLKPGPRFKGLLESAYDAQLEGETPTRDAALDRLRREVTGG